MLSIPGSLSRPATSTLLALLAIAPVGYLYGHTWFYSQVAGMHWVRRSDSETHLSNYFHTWLFNEIDYSRGFKNRRVDLDMVFVDSNLKEKFESEFWPQHLRRNSSNIFSSPTITDASRIGKNKWRFHSSVFFATVQGDESYLRDTIIFDVDLSAKPYRVLNFKHEYPEIDLDKFLADKKISEQPKYSARAVNLFKKAVNENFKKNYQLAIEDLSKALAIEPNFYNAAVLRSEIAVIQYNPEKAEQILTETITLLPNRWSLYRARACTRMDQGNYELALVDLNLSIKKQPEIAATYLNRGYCLSQFKKHKEALKDMDLAIKLEPDCKFFHFFRALERESNGDIIGAFFDFAEVKQHCPGQYFDKNNQRCSVVPYVTFAP